MSETLRWWVMMQVVGLALLPLCLTLFRRLPDRGYALSKPFALLLVGYLFWVLNVMHVLPNTTAGIWWALVLLGLGSAYVYYRRRDELLTFVRERWWLIGATEALLFLAFVTAAYLRSYVPDISGTEQPMDFMFLNAVTRADRFPPDDPWLTGENVAYYYFGYLLVSVMTRLSGLATSVGYNLGLAMIVSLAAAGVFGLVYNLAALREERRAEGGPGTAAARPISRPLWRPMAFGLVAAMLLAVMGNMEGLLEWLAAHGVGSGGFWSWVGIQDGGRQLVPYDSDKWYPNTSIFWWLATRVVEVKPDLFGIHEFPFFSFLLGDLHPHVMSIPFMLLAAGAGLALLRSEGPLDLVFWLERPFWLALMAVILGALAFLNTWDMPTMAFVILLVALLRNRLLAGRWSWGLLLDAGGFVLPLFFAAFLAYVPFFFGGFDSQASGFTADAYQGTRLFHTLLIWGPFAALVLPYAVWRLSQHGRPVTVVAVLWALAPAVAAVALWVVWDLLAAALGWLPAGVRPNEAATGLWSRIAERGGNWLTVLALGGCLGLLVLALTREVETVKRPRRRAKHPAEERLSHVFALALATTAALLILGAELFFIKDQFDARMNTVFKLYYQSWLVLSIAGGFALYELTRDWRLPTATLPKAVRFQASLGSWSSGEPLVAVASFAGAIVGIVLMQDTVFGLRFVGALIGGGIVFAGSSALVLLWRATQPRPKPAAARRALTWRSVWAAGAAVLLLAAFTYPLLAPFERTNAFDGRPRTLDGLAYLKRNNPDEYEAIRWLAEQDGRPVVAEAIGQGYRVETSRVSGATGLPTILGWPGHESQWRGGYEPQAGREDDLRTLYTSSDPDEVRSVIQKYGVSYVFLGPVERDTYGQPAIGELDGLFEPVFEQGEVVIYRVRTASTGTVTRE